MYLVDTNIVSESAPSRAKAPAELVAWMETHSARLFLSAVTIAEIEAGIAKVRREGAVRKASDLAAWLETLLHLYSDRVLAFDVEIARIAGGLSDHPRAQGRPAGLADIIIAATAKRHSLTVLTRNLKHFEPLGAPAFDPFVGLPET